MRLQDVLKMHQAATDRNDLVALSRVEKSYLKVLEDTPDYAQLLQLLGTLYMQTNRNSLGIQILERTVALDQNIGEAWNNLGNAYRIEHHVDRAERCYKEAVRCKPDNAENWNNLGTNYVNEGRPAEGEKILRKAMALDPKNSHCQWNLGLVLLEQGKYQEGFKHYHAGFGTGIRYERFYGCPEWDGKPTDHLIIYGEQGIGDEIMYLSLLPLVKNVKKLTVDCHPRLIKMFERAYPHITFHPTRKDRKIDWALDEVFTARCSIGDLPRHYIKTYHDFPKSVYLSPDADKQNKIKLPDGINIGISWEGGKKKTRNDLRSISLDKWLPIIKAAPNVNFISMQYTPMAAEEISAFNKQYGCNIKHYSYTHEQDYDWTLALASKMDLIITVNTSLVHLCGASGIRAWVLTPFGKAWRYWSPDGHSMAWYGDHVRQYMQQDDKQWQPIIDKVVHDLKVFVNDKR